MIKDGYYEAVVIGVEETDAGCIIKMAITSGKRDGNGLDQLNGSIEDGKVPEIVRLLDLTVDAEQSVDNTFTITIENGKGVAS